MDEGNIYCVPIRETQVLETQFPFNGMPETQVPETQFSFNCMPETQVSKIQIVDYNTHETKAGVERNMLNIHNRIDVCVDTVFPTNEEYEETHFNANLNVDDYMHNEFHTQSPVIPPLNVSS